MLYLSQSIVLSQAAITSLINPAFLWQNRITAVAVEHEDASYPATNLLNPQTSSLWKSNDDGTQTLTVDISGGDETDAFGIARHNFAGMTLTIEGITADIGADWEILAELAPGDNEAILAVFEPGHYAQFRLTIDAGAVIPQAAVIYAGTLLRMVTGIPPGHRPIKDAYETTMLIGMAENGDFLDDIITSERRTTSIQFTRMDGDWYRENFRPFTRSRVPFFWAEAPALYPDEVSLSKFAGNPQPTISNAPNDFDISFDVVGLAL